MPETPERTALYRHFDADRNLLYIGISVNPESRWKSHLYSLAEWPKLAASRTDEWFDTREAAEIAEVAAIKAERPRFNGSHNFVEASFTPTIWTSPIVGPRKREVIAVRVSQEIESGNWPPGVRIPSASQIAAETGVSLGTATKAVTPFIRNGVLEVQGGRGVFVTRPHWSGPKVPHDWYHQLGFPG
ncbi:GntR family transcriptional regulator [Streptomyces sp. NPDC059445]|uniref:GntR family transcriptional regulator n=1 Tax=Streptomyces sp. NPDC059445 TaxID=3346832 RepID=UPI003687CFC3